VKAKNKLDGRIYAIKKIRLRQRENDDKIFREVTALAKLSHRFIVRYYTSWIEIADGSGSTSEDDSDTSESQGNIDDTVTMSRSNSKTGDIFQVDLDDLTRGSQRQDSFPGIYFGNSNDSIASDDDDSGSSDSEEAGERTLTAKKTIPPSTLYIQMVESTITSERFTHLLPGVC
jgi:eukaryotic translation initiation factor 2-alpha kinase 4